MTAVHRVTAAPLLVGLLGVSLCAATPAAPAARPADGDVQSPRRAAAADDARRGGGLPQSFKPQPAKPRGIAANAARVRSVLGAQARGRAAQPRQRGTARTAGAAIPESAAPTPRHAAPGHGATSPAPPTTAAYVRAVTQSRMLGGTPAPAVRLGGTPAAKGSRKSTIDGAAVRRRY